jgi:CheY-like chemotaxis protein
MNKQKALVLVVDDVNLYFNVMRKFMEPFNIRLHYAASGQEAVDAIRGGKVQYNAVFIDKMMSGMDGIETVKQIRRIGTKYAGTIPLIAVSSDASLEDKRLFLSLGFQDFIMKPITLPDLETVVRRWILPDTEPVQTPEALKERKKDSLFNKQIEGLDMRRCPEHFGGDDELFGEFLEAFIDGAPELIAKAEEALKKDNLGEYTIYIHALKGSCRNICADEPEKQAAELEKAAKEGNADFVREHSEKCLEAVKRLVKSTCNALGK